MIRGGMNTFTKEFSCLIQCDVCGARLATHGWNRGRAIKCAEAQGWVVLGKVACKDCAAVVVGEVRDAK